MSPRAAVPQPLSQTASAAPMPTPERIVAGVTPDTTEGRVDLDRYPHLKSEAAAHVGAPLAERKHFVRAGCWIGYTRAVSALARLEELLDHPRTHRMPNLLIVGDTNNGKTAIVRRFQALHTANDAPDEDGVVIPALLVQAPPQPDETEFYDAILGALAAPYRPNDRAARKRAAVVTLLRRTRVRILIVDEIRHVLAGAAIKQRQFLNMLKYLGNEVQIPIVGLGIQDALNALQSDPQLANRFEPVALPRWTFDADYLRLLASVERLLPLAHPSHLIDAKLAHHILALAEGTIGEVMELLQRGAIAAMISGTERITVGVLDGLKWVPPSARQRMPR